MNIDQPLEYLMNSLASFIPSVLTLSYKIKSIQMYQMLHVVFLGSAIYAE